MLVRQSKNTFIRVVGNRGYVMNQMTYQDRTYDEIGTIFLLAITREPQNIEEIVKSKLMAEFEDIDYETLICDFKEFVEELALHNFVVCGETLEELDNNEINFRYANGNMKVQIDDFTQETKQQVFENTQDFGLESAQRKPELRTMQIEVSSRCNERCIHCYIPNSKKNEGSDVPLDKLKDLIDQFAEMGGLHITLSGGEAFLHPNIIELVQYCRLKDLRISLLSNLIALRQEQVDILKKANLSLVQTSLYSMIPEHHDYITTVKGSFERTKKSLEMLVSADIPVQISCPVMKANANDYKDVMKYAQSLNIKAQTDYILMAQSNLCQDNLANRLSLEETEQVIRDIIEYDLDYAEETLNQKPQSIDLEFRKKRYLNQPLCGAGMNECCVGSNGDVFPCAGWQGYVLGNINEQSLREIWENSEKAQHIRSIKQSDFPQCLECEALDYCARCLVRNFNECNGNMLALPKHFCDVAFLNKKIVEEYKAKGRL